MTRHHGHAIPYEGQTDRESNRTCGAAALAMVYRSLAASRAAPSAGAPAAADGRKDRRTRHAGPSTGWTGGAVLDAAPT